jgi:hypothetical protein
MVFRFGEPAALQQLGSFCKFAPPKRDDPKVIQPIVVVRMAAAIDVALNTCHLNRIDLI